MKKLVIAFSITGALLVGGTMLTEASRPGEWICMASASRNCDAIGSDFNKKIAQQRAAICCEDKCKKECKEMVCMRVASK